MPPLMTLMVHARVDTGAGGQIWVHMRADMGIHERAVMGLKPQVVSA